MIWTWLPEVPIEPHARGRIPLACVWSDSAAERVQKGATKTAWITFAAMAISLVAAIVGAMVERRRAARRLVDNASVRATPSTTL